MRLIKQTLIVIIFLTTILVSAADSKARLTFEPIYGVETSLVRYPEPRYITRGTYGARVLYGITLLSAEAEYTTSKSRHNFSNPDREVDNSVQRGNLGIRSTFPMSQYFAFYFRAGGSASQGETKVTTVGVTETHDNPLRVDLYAGTGLQIALHQFLAINAGAVMIRNAENKYDVQYTLGLSARLGNP